MDEAFFIARIGVLGRSLTEAVQEHALTPYDFASLQVAKDTSTARRFPLIVPWNYTASALTFKDADSAMVIFNYGTINITASDTIPAGAHILMMRSGRFNVSSGVTLRINAQFNGERKRTFYGGGAVQFGNAAVEEIYPEWFGAANDSVTTISDSGPAFKLAIDAAANGAVISLANDGRSLQSPKGYVINTTVRIPSDRAITIKGNGSVIYSSANDTVFVLQNGSQTTVPSYAISPTRDQPRHHFNGIRFKRTAATKATGVAIAAINTTGITIANCDFYDYKSTIVFNNQSDGWCENNEIYNCRIAGMDTAILYKVTNSGNNSFATNTLSRVTITAFDSLNARYGVGVYSSTSANMYRNHWDAVVVFPRDSVTCFYFGGKAEDLTGSANIEYIGAKERNEMKGFAFGSSSSELRFRLHVNITGRRFFDEPNLFYSQIPGSFGYTGITTTLDGNQNHGIETVVDSSKFTTLFSVIKNNRLGMATPADSARIFFANVNNSADGKLDIRARRNAPIEIRSYTDNVYSSPTANNTGGSALPLQPVRLLDIGSNRSVSDSVTIDIRNTTHLVLSSSSANADTFRAMKGGVVGQTVTVAYASSNMIVANLSGGTGSGRLFLIDNDAIHGQSGMKSTFKCESESGGNFWRELTRTGENQKTTNYTSTTVDSVDAAQVNFIRLNMSSAGNMRNFYNGLDGQIITVLHRTANTTMIHLGKGTSKGLSNIDAANLTGSAGLRQIYQYDAQDDLWRELSRSSTSSGSVDSTGIVNLGVAAGDLSNASILNAKIANSAVDSNKVKASHITSTDIKDAEVLNADIAASAVDSTKIKASHVTSSDIKDGDVLNADLGASSVNSAKIAILTAFLNKPDMLEFLGGALQATTANGASDTTANYMPLKAFSVGDTATLDFSTSKRFTFVDSVVVLAYSNTATSNVVFNAQIRQVQIGGAIAGAFLAATSKTIATGAAGTLRQWSFTSFGTVTASVYSNIVGKIYRTSGGTGGDIFVLKVLIYGLGLR